MISWVIHRLNYMMILDILTHSNLLSYPVNVRIIKIYRCKFSLLLCLCSELYIWQTSPQTATRSSQGQMTTPVDCGTSQVLLSSTPTENTQITFAVVFRANSTEISSSQVRIAYCCRWKDVDQDKKKIKVFVWYFYRRIIWPYGESLWCQSG